MVPGFPNMWTIYGPNTNGGLHPAAFDEMITLYAMQCIGELILTGKRTIEPKEDAYWQFAREVDEQNARMVWSDPRVHSYYWSRHDRSTTMCPLDPSDVWRMLRYPALDELEIR
jgi:4-hydroxyacetophenone monooxygenase